MTEEKIFRDIAINLNANGKISSPRGLLIKELENFSCIFPPYSRFANFKDRKMKLNYIKKEFLWYLKGDRYDISITNHAKIWKDIIQSDGGINSNYGQYIFFGKNNQFVKVIETLTNDKDSRRASIMILSSSHLLYSTNDIPCTYGMNFRIRENKLNMSVHMRSQDAIFGFGSDIPSFSFIQEMVYCSLKEIYPELQMGNFHHSVDSFHIYEKHFEMLEKIANGSSYQYIFCPKMYRKEEVDFLRNGDFSDIPENFEFSKWLIKNE